MKYSILIITLFAAVSAQAQSDDEAIRQTVNRVFTAMKEADSVMLADVFAPGAIMQTIVTDRNGKTEVRTQTVASFVNFVGQASKGDADERITFGAVQSDGRLASVWTPYTFYYKGNFSHCGVNSFQLVKLKGTWKIQYIIDTRKKEKCE